MSMWWTEHCYITPSTDLEFRARSTCLCACLHQSQQRFHEVASKSALQRSLHCCLLGRFAKMLRLVGHDLKQSLCCGCSHEHCIHSCEAKISSLSMESIYLLNLSFSSCLHLRTMCSFSLILRTTMIFERMFTIGFVAITHVDVSRNYLKIWDVD